MWCTITSLTKNLHFPRGWMWPACLVLLHYYFYAKWTPGQNTCLIMLCAAMFLWLLITTVIESFSCPTRRVAPTKNFKQKIPAYQPMCIHVSASIWKWVYRDFGSPLIKILFFGPLDSTEKITTNGLLGNSNRQLHILLQSLRPTGLVRSFIFKYYSDFLIFNTTYAFDGCKWVCEAFLPFFYLKIIKGRPAQKTMWVFIIFIVLVAQLLLRTDAIPYRPIFI